MGFFSLGEGFKRCFSPHVVIDLFFNKEYFSLRDLDLLSELYDLYRIGFMFHTTYFYSIYYDGTSDEIPIWKEVARFKSSYEVYDTFYFPKVWFDDVSSSTGETRYCIKWLEDIFRKLPR